jgi:hypothetical protein
LKVWRAPLPLLAQSNVSWAWAHASWDNASRGIPRCGRYGRRGTNGGRDRRRRGGSLNTVPLCRAAEGMAARCLSARRLPGRQLRLPSGRYRSPTPLLCYPFLRRVRWREVSPPTGQRPILHSAFRALRNRPKSRFLCRCCKRSSHSYGWVAANRSFGVAARGARPKDTFATIMIIAGDVEVKPPRRREGP